MTKKQKLQAVKAFKGELISKGWAVDRFGNYLGRSKKVRVTFSAIVWKMQTKVNGKWVTSMTEMIRDIDKATVPELPKDEVTVEPKAKKAQPLITHVTDKEAERTHTPLKVQVALDAESAKRIDAMAFKQVSTNSRMDMMEKTMQTLIKQVSDMAGMVHENLRRIKSPPALVTAPLFYHKMFTKISLRLRKKSIDVQVEDTDSGVKRKRVFRCTDWTRVEHLMSYRTLTDGIEELEVKKPVRRAPKKGAVGKKRAPKKAKTIEDIRYEMERDGIPNSVVPSDPKRFTYYDHSKEEAQVKTNRTRAKAEKVIAKLCGVGGPAEGAVNDALIGALIEAGFTADVAFAAAMNCGRVNDPATIRHYTKKQRKASTATSNEY